MPTTQSFTLATVLSVATGRLLCPIDKVYAILTHMTGEEVYTQQLPRARRECAPWLLRWFPALGTASTVDLDAFLAPPTVPQEGILRWLATLMDSGLAAYYDVGHIPPDDHDSRDPIAELRDMVGKDRVMVVEIVDMRQA